MNPTDFVDIRYIVIPTCSNKTVQCPNMVLRILYVCVNSKIYLSIYLTNFHEKFCTITQVGSQTEHLAEG